MNTPLCDGPQVGLGSWRFVFTMVKSLKTKMANPKFAAKMQLKQMGLKAQKKKKKPKEEPKESKKPHGKAKKTWGKLKKVNKYAMAMKNLLPSTKKPEDTNKSKQKETKEGKSTKNKVKKPKEVDDGSASDVSEDSLFAAFAGDFKMDGEEEEEMEVEEEVEEREPSSKRQRGDDGQPRRPMKQPPTVFVRNLPLVAEKDQVKERFEQFGPVKQVFLLTDPETGNPTGSGFVHFVNEKSVERCLDEANKELELTKMNSDDDQPNSAPLSSVMPESKRSKKRLRHSKDAMNSAEANKPAIYWQGWRLIVDRALDHNAAKASTKQAQKEKLKKKEDTRNLAYAREGRIRPGTAAAEGLDEKTLRAMDVRYAEKKKKLKNPNFYVSKTRLCVHHVPFDMDEKELRRVFLGAVKKEVAKTGFDPCGDWDTRPVDRKGRKKGDDPTIRQAKLIRDKERNNHSRGYGFVDFKFHEHALIALRGINNNPSILGSKQRMFVEFAVDNMQKLNIMKLKQERWQTKARHLGPESKEKPEKKEKKDAKFERPQGKMNYKVLDGVLDGITRTLTLTTISSFMAI